MPNEDIVRVMRVIIYEGDRDWVEDQVNNSIKGTRIFKNFKTKFGGKITVQTINEFPEIIKNHENNSEENLNDHNIANAHLMK